MPDRDFEFNQAMPLETLEEGEIDPFLPGITRATWHLSQENGAPYLIVRNFEGHLQTSRQVVFLGSMKTNEERATGHIGSGY